VLQRQQYQEVSFTTCNCLSGDEFVFLQHITYLCFWWTEEYVLNTAKYIFDRHRAINVMETHHYVSITLTGWLVSHCQTLLYVWYTYNNKLHVHISVLTDHNQAMHTNYKKEDKIVNTTCIPFMRDLIHIFYNSINILSNDALFFSLTN
jgi:hypothetical protein